MGINFLSKKANWILEILSHKDEITKDKLTKKYRKFGHYDDKKMLKTLELLDRYASCVAKWNKKNIITITGPISVLSDVSEKIEKGRIVKIYPVFQQRSKASPITQVFNVIIIEYESKKYCADIIFTEANWDDNTKFEEISKENCGKDHLNSNWGYKKYIKDYKIMGELFKNKLEFLEWYIGFELIDLLQNAGFDKIKKLDICDNSKLFKEAEPTSKNKFKKYKNELYPPTFSKKFKNIKLSDITQENREKYKKSNIRIYQDFIINFNRRKRIPNWVLEYLTKESMNNLTAGRHGIWSPDPDFSEIFQPKYADYECHPNSIHNHGHLATGNLHPHKSGFYLTNSVPQYNLVNRGHWRVIEEYISCMAKGAEETFIYTGPLFLPNQKKNLMEFQVVGSKEIYVPTHLFKIVILKIFDNSAWKYWLESYVMTNTDLNELFDENNEKTNPFNPDGSPDIVHNCREKQHFLEHLEETKKYTGNNFPRYIVDLLKYYRKPYKFIEENSDFRLLTLLSEKIKGVKDGVLFDMEIEYNKPDDASENLSLNNSETIKDKVDNIDIGESQTENKKSKKKKSKQKKNNDLKIEEPAENIDKETANLKLELIEDDKQKLVLDHKNEEWQEASIKKKKKGKKQNKNKKIISDIEEDIEDKNNESTIIEGDDSLEEQYLNKLKITDDNFQLKQSADLQLLHEAETSNETISVDSKKADKGKKKKNKGKSKIKEQDNNKKKNAQKDLEDIKFLDDVIKQKDRHLREIDQQNKKAVKEAKKANKSVLGDNSQEIQKIREIITKNDELLFQPSSEKIVPGSPAIIHINTAFELALNVLDKISLNKKINLKDYYWIEQSIISFFEEIKDYFLLFNISFEMITNWRYDNNFVKKFEDNLYSISMKYQPLAEHNKELILLGHKFLEFYRTNEYNVFDIIEEDLETSLYFVLDLKQKEGEKLSVEYAINESIFKNQTTLYTMNILYFNMDKIEDATLHDLAVNIYNFLQYSILFNEIIQKQRLVDNRLTKVGPSILIILYEKIMPSIEIENESLYDIVDAHITLITNKGRSEFPEIINNTIKLLQDVISNILIEKSDKENETEENLEVKEKGKNM
uniref:Uncharacterized protein n=1 Tax=Meloidogyne enterolobii TaxID=390850 RepID=A0A6V7W5T0_MELEN|nr:unnamed protein product [Meloidogyne enterolobii]